MWSPQPPEEEPGASTAKFLIFHSRQALEDDNPLPGQVQPVVQTTVAFLKESRIIFSLACPA